MRKVASIRALQMALQREAFGRHLRHLRAQRGLTQDGAAHEMGVAPKSLHNWEQGAATPNPTSLRLLSRFYGEPLRQLTSYIPEWRAEQPPPARLDEIDRKLDELLAAVARIEGAVGEDAVTLSSRAAASARAAESSAAEATAQPRADRPRTGRGGRAG